MPPRTWLITGASSGIGSDLAIKALGAGDRVIATSRSVSRLGHLEAKGAAPLALDHNQSLDHVKAAINEALQIYGGVDVLVNNAAYVQTGMLEETTPEETHLQFQSNVFGPLNVYRAILPHMRRKRSGTLATIGSMAAWYPMAGCNLYDASKAATRMVGIGLQSEIAGFGIHHCLIEPGFFRTDLLKPDANMAKTGAQARLPDYEPLNATNDANFEQFHGRQLGDPVRGAEVIFDVLTATGVAGGRKVPAFLPLGSDAVAEISKSAQATLDQIKEWESVAKLSDFS